MIIVNHFVTNHYTHITGKEPERSICEVVNVIERVADM